MFYAATNESTAAPSEETTAVPPGKTSGNIKKEKKILLISKSLVSKGFYVCYGMFSWVYSKSFLFHIATNETTAAPSEETTAVQPGKTPNNIKKEKKILLI